MVVDGLAVVFYGVGRTRFTRADGMGAAWKDCGRGSRHRHSLSRWDELAGGDVIIRPITSIPAFPRSSGNETLGQASWPGRDLEDVTLSLSQVVTM
jgi:hypothetical protein